MNLYDTFMDIVSQQDTGKSLEFSKLPGLMESDLVLEQSNSDKFLSPSVTSTSSTTAEEFAKTLEQLHSDKASNVQDISMGGEQRLEFGIPDDDGLPVFQYFDDLANTTVKNVFIALLGRSSINQSYFGQLLDNACLRGYSRVSLANHNFVIKNDEKSMTKFVNFLTEATPSLKQTGKYEIPLVEKVLVNNTTVYCLSLNPQEMLDLAKSYSGYNFKVTNISDDITTATLQFYKS